MMMEETTAQKGMLRLGIASLVIGIWADFLFFGKDIGISYMLFVFSIYALFFWQAKQKSMLVLRRRHLFAWGLSLPILLLSTTFLLFSNTLFHFINFLLIPFLFIVQTILLTESNRKKWYTLDFLGELLGIVFIHTLQHVRTPFSGMKEWLKSRVDQKKYGVGLKVATGIGISLPILLVVLSLLSQADGVFGFFLSEIPRVLLSWTSFETLWRLFLIALVAMGLFAYFHALMEEREEHVEIPDPTREEHKIVWDGVIMVTVLTMINIVYIAFTVIQISYLFTGNQMLLPAGMTYAEYAKNGFNELVMVTLINFAILLMTMHFASRAKSLLYRLIQGLLSLLTVGTGFMLFSAYFRLSLYEAYYGYTYSRLLGHAFMIFLAILLVISLVKIWHDRFSLIQSFAIVGLASYVLLNYVNMDAIIAKNNIARYHDSKILDIDYLTELSYDAVPIILSLAEDERVGSEVVSKLERRIAKLPANDHWQSFNFSTYQAKKWVSQSAGK